MIITIRDQVSGEERSQLAALLCQVTGNQRPAISTTIEEREVIVLDGGQLDAQTCTAISDHSAVEGIVQIHTPYQLVSKAFKADRSSVQIGDASTSQPVIVGGSAAPVVIAGPCAVESREQLLETALAVKAAGAQVLRGGAFKPRTSPYQFQGLGLEGLHLLAEARESTGLPVITEVMEPEMVEPVAEYADILQIGSRNMQNFPLLFAAGRHSQHRPVMLKRGLPVIVDPSHGTGRRELVPTMSRAGIAAGADGLILEVHHDPNSALCDGRQSITPEQLQSVVHETRIMNQLLEGKMLLA